MTADTVTAQDEVVDICRDLIRIDTSNPGDHSGPGERQAAEYVAAKLSEAGLEPTVLESHPKRTSVVARLLALMVQNRWLTPTLAGPSLTGFQVAPPFSLVNNPFSVPA